MKNSFTRVGDESGMETYRQCSYNRSILLNWRKDHLFVNQISLLLHHGEQQQIPGKEQIWEKVIFSKHSNMKLNSYIDLHCLLLIKVDCTHIWMCVGNRFLQFYNSMTPDNFKEKKSSHFLPPLAFA